MSDSPRWHLDGLPGTTGIVEVMLYADHLAAVAAAEQRAEVHATRVLSASNYKQGVKDGVKAARDAVAAHIRSDLTQQEMFSGRKSGLLAAIDGVKP